MGVCFSWFGVVRRWGQDDEAAVFSALEAAGDDLADEVGGEFVGFHLFDLMSPGELKKGFTGGGASGERGADLGELAGAAAVFEGVEVAFGGAGAGAFSSSAFRLGFGRWVDPDGGVPDVVPDSVGADAGAELVEDGDEVGV